MTLRKCVYNARKINGKNERSGRPTCFADAHPAEEEDEKGHDAENQKQRRPQHCGADELQNADGDADPKALLAEVVYVPGIFNRGPEDALQPAVASFGF